MSLDDSLPAIAVGLLSYNRAADVLRSLAVLLDSDYPSERLRPVVIDNGGSDDTREQVVARYGDRVEVVRLEDNMGAIARNAVMLGRDERYVFQFDEDCAPADRDTLRRAVKIMESNPDIGALCFRSINQFDGRSEWGDFTSVARRRRGSWGYEGIFVIGNGMCFRSEAIRRTRGYDPRIFWGAEEMQLGLELTHHGVTIVYVPELALVHRHAPRAMTRAQALEVDARNNVIIAFTYFPIPLAFLVSTIQIGRRVIASIIRRRTGGVRAALRGAARAIARLDDVLADRRLIPLSRLAEHNRWLFATLFGLRPAPSEPGDTERVARSPRAEPAST